MSPTSAINARDSADGAACPDSKHDIKTNTTMQMSRKHERGFLLKEPQRHGRAGPHRVDRHAAESVCTGQMQILLVRLFEARVCRGLSVEGWSALGQ